MWGERGPEEGHVKVAACMARIGWPRDHRRGIKRAVGGGYTAQAHAGVGRVCRKVARTCVIRLGECTSGR
ncbi:hypothetical protein M5K25_006676 [Dendrobium thyrsiflorum]|uniref:Uncharacterized protein n=1 Tax=Dendrobium thyrsiflorum TaxID=117978 RepID=A0ABD0VJG1_DENTH